MADVITPGLRTNLVFHYTAHRYESISRQHGSKIKLH